MPLGEANFSDSSDPGSRVLSRATIKRWVVSTLFVGLVAAVGVGAQVNPPSLAEAPASCGTSIIDYWIVNDPPAVSRDEYIATQQGMEELNEAKLLDGTPDVNVNASGQTRVTVEFVPDSVIPGVKGLMQGCGNPNVHLLLNYTMLTTPGDFRETSRHALGHALGLFST